jgi:hypothetical protein
MKPAIWHELEPDAVMSIPENISPIHVKFKLAFSISDTDVSQNVSVP